jgi:hypothetical protein
MSEEQKVVEKLLENGSLDNEDQKIRGIAQLAADKGYESLSKLQQKVLEPFLARACDGVENPGGHHNECSVILEGKALAEALTQEAYYDAVLCENCINETEQYANEWAKIQAE